MSKGFNCVNCGAANPHGNTNCYVCLTKKPKYCRHCKTDNNPHENTHCYNCGHEFHDNEYEYECDCDTLSVSDLDILRIYEADCNDDY